MDKYTKSIFTLFRLILGIFCILCGISLLGISIWVSNFSDVASMILIMSFLGGGAIINFGLGYAFLGDEYKATKYVRNGSTTFSPVETPKFLKRRKIVTFTGFVSYIVLALYYLLRIVLVSINKEYLETIDYNSSILALISFTIISLLIAYIMFMIYKRTKHIDLGEE